MPSECYARTKTGVRVVKNRAQIALKNLASNVAECGNELECAYSFGFPLLKGIAM